MITRLLSLVTLVAVSTSSALAQFDSGSDGSDGALDCTALLAGGCEGAGCGTDCSGCGFVGSCTISIDLSLATTAAWNTPSPDPGKGVYDASEWAVVFKYTTIDIPHGVRITFKNHSKGAPVVWLAMGDVDFGGGASSAGNISVSGNNKSSSVRYAEPGPGGFAGGAPPTSGGLSPLEGSAGFGPGGGERGASLSAGGGGSYGLPGEKGFDVDGGAPGLVYGNSRIVPLIGGSGGAGHETAGPSPGGAGGGAILIASSGSINLGPNSNETAIRANGGFGNGGGSGGAIRLIANTISGVGLLRALGKEGGGGTGNGGDGRIRLEAFTIRDEVDTGIPLRTSTDPDPVFPPVGTPTLRAVMVDSVPISPDPRAGVQTVDAEVLTNSTVTLHIEATNIAIGTIVDVRVTPAADASFTVQATPLTGSSTFSTATAQLALPAGTSDIVLRAEPTP